jgi:hypothetical protein
MSEEEAQIGKTEKPMVVRSLERKVGCLVKFCREMNRPKWNLALIDSLKDAIEPPNDDEDELVNEICGAILLYFEKGNKKCHRKTKNSKKAI